MTRAVAALLLVVGVAVAAPVPKVKPGMKDVFGEVIDQESDCKFEWQKGWALKAAVPTADPPAKMPWKPQVAKTVSGDFVLTMRVALAVSDWARAGEGKEPFVTAGVAVCAPNGEGRRYCLQNRVEREPAKGVWRNTVEAQLKFSDSLAGSGRGDIDHTPDRWTVGLRLTRTGDTFLSEYQVAEGKWARLTSERVRDMEPTVLIGPMVFGNIDQDFTATFDEYEVKPLTKDEKK